VNQIYQAIRTKTNSYRQLPEKTSSQTASSVGASQLGVRCQIWNSLPSRLIDRGFPDPAKLVELTPCGHRSERKQHFYSYGVNQNLKQCEQLSKHYLQTEKQRKKCSKQLTKNPFKGMLFGLSAFAWITNDCLGTVNILLRSSMTSRDQNMSASPFSPTLLCPSL
jgi:hypothetical protein